MSIFKKKTIKVSVTDYKGSHIKEVPIVQSDCKKNIYRIALPTGHIINVEVTK